MGSELCIRDRNMAPLLGALVRFVKPRVVLEVGAGYTSAFLLQALADNVAELASLRRLLRSRATADWPHLNWLVEPAVVDGYHWARLVCVDNLAHAGTAARARAAVARELGLDDLLEVVEADALAHADELAAEEDDGGGDGEIDLLWVDFGDGDSLDRFFEKYWPLVNARGGLIVVHSTLTNAAARAWLARMKARARAGDDAELGLFDVLSLLEPHKMRQNSCTLIQRRGYPGDEYSEPIYTQFS